MRTRTAAYTPSPVAALGLPGLILTLVSGLAAAHAPPKLKEIKINATGVGKIEAYGTAVATDGKWAVVGAALKGAGAVYVFSRTGAGGWALQQTLVAKDGAAGDEFGYAVALYKETIVVGAPGDDDSAKDAGAAYVFARPAGGGSFGQQQKLAASDPGKGDRFGTALGVDGTTVAVGAPDKDGVGPNSGAAYVYIRSVGGLWSQQAKLKAKDAAKANSLGTSVSLSGDTLALGAPANNNAAGALAGAVYIYQRSSGAWDPQQKLIPTGKPKAYICHCFGQSVALDGDTVLVGAPFNSDAASGAGAAWVFTRSGTVWSSQQKLLASDAAAGDMFGWSVALDGDGAVIGAIGDDDKVGASGSVYFLARASATWSQSQKLGASNAKAQGELGWSVGLAGFTTAVGSRGQGEAYIYGLTSVLPPPGPDGGIADAGTPEPDALHLLPDGTSTSQEAVPPIPTTDGALLQSDAPAAANNPDGAGGCACNTNSTADGAPLFVLLLFGLVLLGGRRQSMKTVRRTSRR